MGKLPQSDRPLIEPIYPQTSPNQSIELGNTMVEFTHEEKTYRKTARTTVEFLPRIRFLFRIPVEETPQDDLWWFKIGSSLIDTQVD